MSDQALRELLTSPLDDPGRPPLPPRLRAALSAAAGALAGAAIGLGVVALFAEGPDTTTTPPAEATAATTADTPVVAGDRTTAEAAWMMSRADGLYVGVHLVAPPDAETAPAPASAAWTLRLDDGRLIPFRAEHAVFFAPGVVTVEFPVRGIDPADVAGLTMHPAVATTQLESRWDLEVTQLPWRGPAPGPIAAADAFSIVATGLRLGGDGGVVEWQLFGAARTRAIVDAEATWTVRGGEEPQMAAAEYRIGDAPLQLGPLPADARSSGTLDLFHLDDPQAPTYRSRWWGDPGPVEIDGLAFVFRVTVYDYAEDGIDIPLEGIPIVVG